MRATIPEQFPLVPVAIDHGHACELRTMSATLDAHLECAQLVYGDMIRGVKNPGKGRRGMSGDQVLRALLVKQLRGFSYDLLAFHLADSSTYRAFCRVGTFDEVPSASTLQRNIKRVRPDSLERINAIMVQHAQDIGMESGSKVRFDCTVTESNIHPPTDSMLLWDCVRVLARLLERARELVRFAFSNHTRRAKRRSIGIMNTKGKKARKKLYRDLLKISHKTVGYAERGAAALDGFTGDDLSERARAMTLAKELRHYAELAARTVDQTRRRVIHGETVPARDKVVSIFEEHTDIIRKDYRDTYYGHKICLGAGASGLITDCTVLDGNPADSTLAVDMVERHTKLYGVAPKQVALDGGFASKQNLADIKALGVEDCCFSKGRGLAVTDMVKSTRVYRHLRNFRAGIESCISFLKRSFGLDRCTWRGLPSYKAYVWGSIVSANLLVIARHVLG